MPEVIDLLSSTPPPPIERREQLSIRRAHSHPPVVPASDSIFSDEIDLSAFTYDNPIEQPAKRRRLSHEITPAKEVPLPPAKNSLFLFSDDDIILSSDGPAPAKPPAWNGESDPIVFTSSAPETRHNLPVRPAISSRDINPIPIDDEDDSIPNGTRNNRLRREEIQVSSDQLDFPDVDDLLDVAQRVEANAFSSRTANLLATLEDRSRGSNDDSVSRSTRGRKQQDQSDDIDVEEMPPPRRPQRKTTKVSNEEKEAKAREREAAKAQRERDKQLEKERKQKAKEDKAREKQLAADIAEVNKLKVDKKDSTHEMLIDLASTFTDTSLGNQTSELMCLLKVDLTFFPSAIPNIVKWRRKVRATYNDSLGHWEPCALHIREEEEHVLCLIAAQDFIDMIVPPPTSEPRNTVSDHVQRLKSAYPKSRPIYLIEGLTSLMRKNNNAQNRAYQAAVRRQFEDTSARPSGRRKQQQPETITPIDSDTVEDALLDLQVTHSCLIHHTSSPAESAEWIKNFTEYISTVPYRRERMDLNDSAFCMDVGQVKPGENRSDAFVKMIQEVNRVTASMAYGIATQYPSAMDLVNAMRKHGPGLLEDVKKSANKNGALTDSRIGPAVSRRLYKVFMGMDPTSTDI
ncbi:alpha-1,2-mannosyltransferase [Aspergillus piperis CBS 112811]|uniref:Alpha-1,2-mannosyltransferase n=1 Tax=Aspergillus piperis CBS 112811 TaxID=1448313 RepID=A0A8G1QZ47_9EURO|nr:alpha-1,2-mannosyltransferase [Aspergillus piperis CBS 112811]RAH56237.1 alpha-1,2-mannosyltransferase [Aspergillus piperis CBS 112811]